MKTHIRTVMTAVVVGAGLLQLAGCTVTNYYLGKAIDNRNRKFKETSPWKVKTVSNNTEVRIVTRQNDTIDGRFAGVAPVTTAAYRHACRKLNDSLDNPVLPDPDAAVTVHLGSGHTVSGHFRGCDYQFIKRDFFDTAPQSREETLKRNAHYQCLLIEAPGDPEPFRVFLRDVDRIKTSGGDATDGQILFDLASTGHLPLRSAIILNPKALTDTIPLDNIDHFSSKQHLSGNARWIGLGLGIAADAVLVAIATTLIVMSISDYTLL